MTSQPRRLQRPFCPRLERLDERTMPAGTVHANLFGGLLTLSGIDKTAQAEVLAGLNDQHISITGTGPGSFTVAGVAGTTIDGLPSITVSKVNTIRLNLRLGDDVVDVNSATLSGNLTFLGGSGDDSITFGTVAGNHTFGSVTLDLGDGTDQAIFTAGSTKIGGALRVVHADGFCSITLNTLLTDELTAASININGGGALTNVFAGGNKLAVSGPVTISGGSGSTTLDATTTTFDGNLSVTRKHAGFFTLGSFGDTIVGKGATINVGAGPTLVALEGD